MKARIALGGLLALAASPALFSSVHPHLELDQLAAGSDLVFVGTVVDLQVRSTELMIWTDVRFAGVETVRSRPQSRQAGRSEVLLSVAGGELDGVAVEVSGAPSFVRGERYLLFVKDDGRPYANPIVGGPQGLFRVTAPEPGTEVVEAASGPLGLTAAGLAATPRAEATSPRSIEDPTPKGSGRVLARPDVVPTPAASLADVKAWLRSVGEPGVMPAKWGSTGRYVSRSEEGLESSALPTRSPAPALSRLQSVARAGRSQRGGSLGYCGYQSLPLIMEQVPQGWWSWSINNNSMWTWNQFMDIYQYTDDDGTFGNNSQNEFCGWVDDATLNSVYGFNWNGGIAMTITWTLPLLQCAEILQSDVLWNPAYSWTDDFTVSLGDPNVINLTPVCMHELGHTWGAQRGDPGGSWGFPETLDYDLLSVMHAYYWDLVEDGWGVHAADANMIRALYQNQTSVLPTIDVGVESYWAQDGLINATTNASVYQLGEAIDVLGMSVENNSATPLFDVRFRVYLSSDRSITASDTQVAEFYWNTFNGESYWSGDIQTQAIPATLSPGTYYVGMHVTQNGYNGDDYNFNDRTTLYRTVTIDEPPVDADFSATPLSGSAPLTVDFTDLSTGSPTSWMWDFGDGATDTSQNPTHAYAYGGRYTVTLTASKTGSTDSETKVEYVTVWASEEIVTGPGPDLANPPTMTTWDHSSPPATMDSWSAYGATQWGTNVAMGNIDGATVDEALSGPGPGGIYGPQIRAFQPDGTPVQKVNFYAYGTLRFGAEPAGGDVDGDLPAEILTSPGPGAVFGPHIRAWNFDGSSLGPVGKVNFYAFATLKFGARVGAADADADRFAEILAGAGAGAVFSPHARAFNFDGMQLSGTAVNLFAFSSGQYGARVSGGDTDGDGRETVIVAHGPDPNADTQVRGFDWDNGVNGVFSVTASTTALGGAEVAAGDLDADAVDELIVGLGWGAANPAQVQGFAITGSVGNPVPGVDFDAYPGLSYGVKVALGDTGAP